MLQELVFPVGGCAACAGVGSKKMMDRAKTVVNVVYLLVHIFVHHGTILVNESRGEKYTICMHICT